MVSVFSSKVFLIEVFFRDNAIAPLIDYSRYITFICTKEEKSLCVSLHCGVHFITVVWDQTCKISEVCLLSQKFPLGSRQTRGSAELLTWFILFNPDNNRVGRTIIVHIP